MLQINNKEQNILSITVFITGATTMILELVGSRIISPYFGNTIFTWTSLIGIVLGSLSIGYWLGGKLADRQITLSKLSLILLINSATCSLIFLFANPILKFLFVEIKNIAIGTLISSILIFSLPSMIFGLIPPYVAKFKIKSLNNSGKAVGNLYALSTIGSICGTFLTGYYLLSFIGSFQIILLISIALILNSMLLNFSSLRIIKILLFFIYIWLLFTQKNVNLSKNTSIISSINSVYSTYFIADLPDKLGRRRNLLDGFRGTQSSYIVSNDNLQVEYTKYFTVPACYKENKQVLMIGGGGFSYAKYFLKVFPENQLDVIEIDPKLTQLAEDYFQLPKNRPNVKIINSDGRTYLNSNSQIYNAIIVDAYDTVSMPFHLTTKEALSKMHTSLSDNGIVIMNIVSSIKADKENLLQVKYNTFQTMFPLVELYKVNSSLDRHARQNIILIAYKNANKKTLENCLFKNEKLFNNKFVLNSKDKTAILTDNFAPVEFLSN